jgi:PelA/Pel-15E family pectate lyase
MEMQADSGGFPQFYPSRGPDSYSHHATFNDGAMVRALVILQKAVRTEAPFDVALFSSDQLRRAEGAIEKGVDFILKAQLVSNGVRSVWCAQHSMSDYSPQTARSYELPSKSGSESTLVTAFLMSRPQTPEVSEAVRAALAWFRNPETYLADRTFDRSKTGVGNTPIVPQPGTRMWFRFYELNTQEPMFVDRDGTVHRDILQLDVERKDGYQWGGDWPETLLAYAENVRY